MQHIASHQHHTQCHLLGPVGLFVFQRKQQISPFLFSAFSICCCLVYQSKACVLMKLIKDRRTATSAWGEYIDGNRRLIHTPHQKVHGSDPLSIFKVLVSILHCLITVSMHCFPNEMESVETSLPPQWETGMFGCRLWMKIIYKLYVKAKYGQAVN